MFTFLTHFYRAIVLLKTLIMQIGFSRFAIAIVLSCLFVHCKKTPEDHIEELRTAACKANYKSFLKNVNIDKLKFSYLRKVKEKQEIKSELEANKLFKDYIDLIQDEIARGDESRFCNFIVVTKERSPDNITFHLLTKDKKEFSIHLIKFGYQWLVSEITEPQVSSQK
jgi:hypothetical protein